MASPIFLHELPIEQLQKMSPEDIEQTITAEHLYCDNKPHTIYHLAVNGSKTKNGGLVNAQINKELKVDGHLIAVVGDEVIYSDGSTSKIISGAGKASELDGDPVALVGSRLENGDEIIESLQSAFEFRFYHDREIPEGFLDHD